MIQRDVAFIDVESVDRKYIAEVENVRMNETFGWSKMSNYNLRNKAALQQCKSITINGPVGIKMRARRHKNEGP